MGVHESIFWARNNVFVAIEDVRKEGVPDRLEPVEKQ